MQLQTHPSPGPRAYSRNMLVELALFFTALFIWKILFDSKNLFIYTVNIAKNGIAVESFLVSILIASNTQHMHDMPFLAEINPIKR